MASPDKDKLIRQLAQRHAALRLSRKDRNAELRHQGIDPDGPDGKLYRQLLDAAFERRKSHQMAEWVTAKSVSEGVGMTILYEPTDHALAMALGLVEIEADEYSARLAQVERRLHDAGVPHERLRAGADDVLAFMAANGLANDPQGRTTAYTMMWFERQNSERTSQ